MSFAEVIIGFNQTRYDVSEDDGQAVVYVVVIDGILRRQVVVNFITADNTALGECHTSMRRIKGGCPGQKWRSENIFDM